MSPRKRLRPSSQSTVHLSRPPSAEDLKRVEVVAHESLSISDEENIEPHATTAITEAMKHAEYGAMGDMTAYGNPKGLSLFERLDSHMELGKRQQSQIDSLNDRVDSQQAQINSQQAEINSQQAEINTLQEASQGFRHIRNRFLETYKRDWFDQRGQQSHVLIQHGNASAHHGNAAVDSLLYTDPLLSASRTDESVYRSLYWLSPLQVKHLVAVGHRRSLDILNQHATWVANGQTISFDIAKAFDDFVYSLEANMEGDPSDLSTELGRRYNYFKLRAGSS